MLKKKDSLQSPKIFLEELKSPTLPNIDNIVQPFVFKKNKSPIKTYSFINNDTGKMRHFTPAAQE